MDEREVLQAGVEQSLATYRDVKKVLLYGSRARGDAKADSDYDLVVVVGQVPADDRRAARLRLKLRRMGASFDLTLLNVQEFAGLATDHGSVGRQILAEGKVLLEVA